MTLDQTVTETAPNETAPVPAPAAPADPDGLRLGVVVITMGQRPAELAALLKGVAGQRGPAARTVVVGNGVQTADLGDLGDTLTVDLPENVGIPAGRNAGIEALGDSVDVLVFLDDDGSLPEDTFNQGLRAAFAADPKLGIVSCRITDPVTGQVQRRHVPRIRVGDPDASSEVTTFLGGASAVRRAVIDQVGGLPDEFFYCHEETDLAWRALDAGWSIEYRADLTMNHPATSPSRHATYHRLVARNRVWLARRNLPWPLVPVYLGVWTGLTLARTRNLGTLRVWLAGFAEGWRTPCGPRRAMRWRTVWRMAKLGRPPVI